jgi:CRISPR-associated protein Csc1
MSVARHRHPLDNLQKEEAFMRIYRGTLTLQEHTYFASREIGILYASEPMIGNYALTYALGLCQSPYYWAGGPRYRQDLLPLNEAGIYVTPGTFREFYFAFQQFNAQTDTYFSRFDQNAIGTLRNQKTRANNFPQNGRLRMLGLGSVAVFYVLIEHDQPITFPAYVRLGKFNSKASIVWNELKAALTEQHDALLRLLLNAADLPSDIDLRILSLSSVHPAPLISAALISGNCWQVSPLAEGSVTSERVFLPNGMRYGVEVLP